MGDGFAGIAFALSIRGDNHQGHLTLLKRCPTVMAIAINSMIACDQYGVAAFLPFGKDCAKEHVLLDGLPAVLLGV